MKSTTILTAVFAASRVALAQYQGYGFVSPAANLVVNLTENPWVNLTFNPRRYFKESTINIDVFIVNSPDNSNLANVAQELVTSLTPNIDYFSEGLTTPAYYANLYVGGLPAPVPGTRTVLVKENYYGYAINSSMAFYSQKIQVTK